MKSFFRMVEAVHKLTTVLSCQCDLTKGFHIVGLTQSSYVYQVVKEKTRSWQYQRFCRLLLQCTTRIGATRDRVPCHAKYLQISFHHLARKNHKHTAGASSNVGQIRAKTKFCALSDNNTVNR